MVLIGIFLISKIILFVKKKKQREKEKVKIKKGVM